MAQCSNCGAAINLKGKQQATCPFCDSVNDAPPSQVQVPVPVQVIHNVVNVVGGGPTSVPGELRCPHCRARLVTVRAGDVDLSGCGRCGGIWVDNDSARTLISSPQRVVVELANRASANARGGVPKNATPACPVCTACLETANARGIEIDICPEHGTWFDTFELQAFVRTLLGELAPRPQRGVVPREAQCVSCHATMPGDRANVTGDGPMCDACWRGVQNRQIEEAERQGRDAAGLAGAGLLLGAIGVALLSGSSKS
jgi:Zn-finger nucleic acid-binding protein